MAGADVCYKQQKHNPNNKIYESNGYKKLDSKENNKLFYYKN